MSSAALRLLRDSVVQRWSRGPRARLPSFYKERQIELALRPDTPVHWEPDPREYKPGHNPGDHNLPVQNFPIPALYPVQSQKALWGGEGVVKGYRKKKAKGFRTPRIWMPYIRKSVLYSEILDQHFIVRVTYTTMDLIDKACGFDNYILQTHEKDLKSALGMQFKREMMSTIYEKKTYQDNPKKQEEIYSKYRQYLIPREEVEWLGLSEEEALAKQAGIEAQEREAAAIPLKNVYAELYLKQLQKELGIEDHPETDENSSNKQAS